MAALLLCDVAIELPSTVHYNFRDNVIMCLGANTVCAINSLWNISIKSMVIVCHVFNVWYSSVYVYHSMAVT